MGLSASPQEGQAGMMIFCGKQLEPEVLHGATRAGALQKVWGCAGELGIPEVQRQSFWFIGLHRCVPGISALEFPRKPRENSQIMREVQLQGGAETGIV